MTDDEKKKLLDDYYEDVAWLRAHVPMDDIYEFAQQLKMNAEYFMGRLMQEIDVSKEVKNDPTLANYVRNLSALFYMKSENYPGTINTDIDVIER